MAERNDSAKSHKHVCIFELERKGAYFTGDVICTVCGVKLSSETEASVTDEPPPENQRHL
jgi:hypothetical protein